MPDKPYIIRISSQKGGVGKTTVASNLCAALAMGSTSKILLVDADSSNPSVGFHMGLEDVNIGYEDVARGKVDLKKAIVPHLSSGIYVLPGTIRARTYDPSTAAAAHFMKDLSSSSYDFIVIDTAPGLSLVGPSEYIDEALIITTPEMSACTSSIRLAKQFDKMGIKHSLLVNRVKNRNFEMSMKEINDLNGAIAFGPVPEDEDVQIGVSQHVPTIILNRHSPFAKAVLEVSRVYLAKKGLTQRDVISPGSQSHQSRFSGGGIVGWLKRIIGLK